MEPEECPEPEVVEVIVERPVYIEAECDCPDIAPCEPCAVCDCPVPEPCPVPYCPDTECECEECLCDEYCES